MGLIGKVIDRVLVIRTARRPVDDANERGVSRALNRQLISMQPYMLVDSDKSMEKEQRARRLRKMWYFVDCCTTTQNQMIMGRDATSEWSGVEWRSGPRKFGREHWLTPSDKPPERHCNACGRIALGLGVQQGRESKVDAVPIQGGSFNHCMCSTKYLGAVFSVWVNPLQLIHSD